MPRLDSQHPGAHKPGKTPHRTAAFRETARDIVHKDRYDRRAGMSVDTAGAIARAYVSGLHRCPTTILSCNRRRAGGRPGLLRAVVEWILIPPRPRDAFWTICLFALGRETPVTENASGHLVVVQWPSGWSGWQLVSRDGVEKPFGHATILPLIRLGLLDREYEPDRRLVIGALSRATWQRFVERGGQFPEDLTSPFDDGRQRLLAGLPSMTSAYLVGASPQPGRGNWP